MTRADYRRALKGRRCYVGMDLSATIDLTALAAVFPDEASFDVLMQFFCPKDTIRERSLRDRVPYDEWAKQGYLIPTPGNVVDYEAVRQTLKDWSAEFTVRELAYDPWNATDLINRLKQDGFDCFPMRQGFSSLTAPTKSLTAAILSRRLRHDGHPILRWNISNAAVESDAAGNQKLSKKASTEKIDGAYALTMAVDLLDRNAGTQPPKYQMLVIR